MPGHIKLGKSGEPDPDPLPYLVVSNEDKMKDLRKPYDARKSYWVPDPHEGFVESILLNDDGVKAIVQIGHEKKVFKSSEISQVNPPKFEKCDDMVNLTYLNDGSVFHNLRSRYKAKLIYTYSGLFCVVINPYKRYPIYTSSVVKFYLGKRRNETPPHLWAVTETAYRNMITNKKNQSMLITGESGAGKTENTKKVISYLAMVAASGKKSAAKKATLEDQIVATNPILESYGNAKTARNDNSSRFGKFIRIYFTASGKLAGCDIESYLLEKSRITQQQEDDRSYHIFYQLLVPYVPDMKDKCLLTDDIYDYTYVSQGKVKVPSIDDNEEMEYTDQAFDILDFSETEKWDCYKLTAAVMASGQIRFKEKGRDEQAEPDDLVFAQKVAQLYGVACNELMKCFCKPKIKVGMEWVTKGQNVEQATNAVGAIARSIYDRIFKWLIVKCNATLIDPGMKKTEFVAVLDIAGFEIFDYNSFEQLSINFVNEKLQQFFNHHMFVVEQEEYIGEGIEWTMVDFGMDLAACIYMFEKPMGIWAILEEESLFPKATDKTLEDKLKATHLGKSGTFTKANSKTDRHAHFAIIHYAGVVSYNVKGWLEKNKDPLNDTVVDCLKKASNKLLVHLWQDHPGQSSLGEDNYGGKKKKKKGAQKTVSSVYLVQLNALMTTLNSTEPHFIRCIVPNNQKKPLLIQAPLVMHQLTCNGVLEGIRICMRGFPNRMFYHDFKARYEILGGDLMRRAPNDKDAVIAMMNNINFDKDNYKCGKTKVFFKAGALARLEENRDAIVIKLLRFLQAQCYAYKSRKAFAIKRDRKELINVIQRTCRKYFYLRNWGWFILAQKLRPMIGQVAMEEQLRTLKEEADQVWDAYNEKIESKQRLEEENNKIKKETEEMLKKLETEQGNISMYKEKQAKLSTQKAELEVELAEATRKHAALDDGRRRAQENKKCLEQKNASIKRKVEEMQQEANKMDQEKHNRDYTIRMLEDEIASQDEVVARFNKEKKNTSDYAAKAEEDMVNAKEKMEHLEVMKNKLETTLDEIEKSIEREKRSKAQIETQRRQRESELKMAQSEVQDVERERRGMENAIQRKERDLLNIQKSLDDEQAMVSKFQRSIKENQVRIEEIEEELEAERQARAKAERHRSDMGKELEELGIRLTEACSLTTAQMELNRKREAEVVKLQKDLEAARIQQEVTMTSLKKKHADAISEMTEQIGQLGRMKAKIEKDKYSIGAELGDVRAAIEDVQRTKASAEKSNKSLMVQLNEVNKRLDEAELTLTEADNHKRKHVVENAEYLQHLQDLQNRVDILKKSNNQLVSQLEEAKRTSDEETKERQSLLGKFRNLENEVETMQKVLDDEVCEKEDLARKVMKAEEDVSQWRLTYEQEALAKAEELEMSKMKLQARLTEAQSTMEQLNGKYSALDKSKQKLVADIEDMNHQVDQATTLNNQLEKKAKHFDKIVGDWRRKVDGLTRELSDSQNACRNTASEVFHVKNGYEECVLQLDEVRKENKTLSSEIKDIMDQISEGGRSIHEIDKIRKRLESEKSELTAALEEAESALEQEENKVLRSQLELAQVQEEIERSIAMKEEEFGATKRNFQRALEDMQFTLEQETKVKAEAQRTKKKLEADVAELEISLEHANAASAEAHGNAKQMQAHIREAQSRLEDEERAKETTREHMLASERRVSSMKGCLEEARNNLEQVDKARRLAEQELADTNEQLSTLTCQNQALVGSKRKLEVEMQSLLRDRDEMKDEVVTNDDRMRKVMLDAARLADELRSEQEITQALERDNKFLELQAKELQNSLDQSEVNALKTGKKAINKMETRIRELESDLDSEMRRLGDVSKNQRSSERRIKELTFQSDEDRKNHQRMQDLVDNLQTKIRAYKKQMEEAEEIAALNLARYRNAQNQLAEAHERADINERALAKFKARGRSASVGPFL